MYSLTMLSVLNLILFGSCEKVLVNFLNSARYGTACE